MTKEELLKSRERYIGIKSSTNQKFLNHYGKWDFFKSKNPPHKIGQFFLYETELSSIYNKNIDFDSIVTYPKLGIYLNSLPCDQTIEVEWVDYRRTCETRLKYSSFYKDKYNKDIEYHRYLSDISTEIKRLVLWHDCMLVYDVWDSMPNWKQLRQAYERTWWYHRTTDERREIQINRLLK